MSAILTATPPLIAYSKREMYATLSTDNISLNRAVATITFDAPGPINMDTFTLSFSGYNIKFTFKALPTNIATDLGLMVSGLPLAFYVGFIAESMDSHAYIIEHFEVTYNATTITLTARAQYPINPSVIDFATNVSFTATDAPIPFLQPNLSAYLRLFDENNDPFGVVHNAPYNLENHTVSMDIHDSFSMLQPFLPANYSLDRLAYYEFEEAQNVIKPYLVKFADAYGTPPVPEKLLDSVATLYALYGDEDIVFEEADPITLLHNYPLISKVVTREQPDYAFCFIREALEDVFVRVQLNLSDGTTELYYPLMPPDGYGLESKKVYAFRVGFKQLQLDELTFANGVRIVAYDWQLIQPSATISLKISKSFKIDEGYASDDIYILTDNRCGGMETLILRGSIREKNTVTQEAVDTVPWVNDTQRGGDMDTTESEMRTTYDITTGLLPTKVARYYSELLRGKIWMVDRVNHEFIRAIPNTKDLEINPKVGYNALKFSFTLAWKQ
jgi:hypothetical protein